MAILFHLVRHGSYELLDDAIGGRADHPLSEQGRAEAEQVARWLAGRRVSAVISSPVIRTRQTAETIAGRLVCPIALDAAFTELDYAGWTGKRFSELAGNADWQAWNSFRGTATIPGGESMLAVQLRALAGLRQLAIGYPDQELVVVSHADVIKSVLAHFLGAPLDMMGRIEVAAGSVSQLLLFEHDARIVGVNLNPACRER